MSAGKKPQEKPAKNVVEVPVELFEHTLKTITEGSFPGKTFGEINSLLITLSQLKQPVEE
jgi:hypothetical protein